MTRRDTPSTEEERSADLRDERENASDSLFLPTDLPEENDGRRERRLILTLVLAITLAVAWAAMTKVDEITIGQGVIKTRAETVRVEHPYGGIVSDLNVRIGGSVSRGDVLLSLDPSSLQRELDSLKKREALLRGELSRVALMLRGGAARLELEELPDTPSAEEEIFFAEQDYIEVKLDIIAAENEAIRNRIRFLEESREVLREELDIRLSQRKRSQGLFESGLMKATDLERAQQDWLSTKRDMASIEGGISSERDALHANELRRAELLRERTREGLQRRADLEDRLSVTRKDVADIEERLRATEVAATESGIVQTLAVHSAGEVVAAGDLVAEIVPDHSPLEVEVEIGADSIGSVKPGLPARLRVETFDFTRFGVIEGQVASVSPTSYLNTESATVYRVSIELPEGEDGTSFGDLEIRPGMLVSADILTGQKSILSYVLKPLREIRSRAFSET